MAVTYRVERSISGLTADELNTLGTSNWDLVAIIEESIGYQFIFTEASAPVTSVEYAVAFSTTGLTVSDIQVYGDDDFTLAATLVPDKSIGVYYYFKKNVEITPP